MTSLCRVIARVEMVRFVLAEWHQSSDQGMSPELRYDLLEGLLHTVEGIRDDLRELEREVP